MLSRAWAVRVTFMASFSALGPAGAAEKTRGNELTLVDAGKPAATIIVAATAGRPVRFAADELQRHVETMTKVRLPIAAEAAGVSGAKIVLVGARSPNATEKSVGDSNRVPELKEVDSFHIGSFNDRLLIAGGSDHATLNGVYCLLERMGCRWFGPGEEFVPTVTSLTVPAIDLTETPGLHWRGLELISGSNPSIVDWMAKMRLNVAWPEGYAPNKDLTASEASMRAAAVPQMRERGMTIFWGGHILPVLFPVEKYRDHPEYFALIKGKRLDSHAELQNQNQLCISNPDVTRILTENTITFLRNHPWIDVLFIWAGDTTQWCECDKCLALLPEPAKRAPFGGLERTGLYVRMIKAVSEGVEKALPGRTIAFNHYYNLENIPTDARGNVLADILPNRSVLSAVDDYHQCDRHPFSDERCPGGKRIAPIAKMWSPFYDDSVSWSYYFAWNFTRGLPVSQVHKIPDDFRFVRSLGVNGVLDNVTLNPGSLQWHNNQLNFYVYGKASWNPDLNVDELTADYIRAYYGPAAGPMTKAWQLLEDSTRKYGADSAFMPDDPSLAKSRAIHGRVRDMEEAAATDAGTASGRDVRYLVPNRDVFDDLMRHLDEAGRLAALAAGKPYAGRVLALRCIIASREEDEGKRQVFGYMNGGGNHRYMLYSTGDETSCSVFGGNNVGDCFWTRPLGTEQLVKAGDRVEVTVKINADAGVVGSPLYRSGPGLYQAHDQSSPCGKEGARSTSLCISDLDGDAPDARRVILIANDGKYSTTVKHSAGESWRPGHPVALRIEYLGESAGRHAYRYLFDAGSGWIRLADLDFSEKLSFAAPAFHFTTNDTNAVHYPVMNWASFTGFSSPVR
jgi:hypothetical protein